MEETIGVLEARLVTTCFLYSIWLNSLLYRVDVHNKYSPLEQH